ncbi:uncharacterized protein [Prorops nasuta]|uniref:uncharacterized protein isoform X2 n=1 Tax=Prorops nasuta TaxID=863751 RepID=UPI0034CD06B5
MNGEACSGRRKGARKTGKHSLKWTNSGKYTYGKSSVNAVEAKREGVDEDDSGIFMIGRTEEITSNIDGRSREQKSFEASFDPAYRTIETWGEYEQSTWRTEDRANNDRLDDSPRESLIRVSTIKDNTVAPRSSVPSRKLKKSRNQRLQRLKRDNYKVIANRVSARGGRSKEKFYNGSSVFKGELPGTFKIEKENWPRTNDNSTREKFRREIRERGTPYEKRGEVFRAFPGKLKKDWRNGEVLKSGKSLKADIEFRDEDGKYDKLMSARRGRERMQGDENSLRESWRSLAGGVSRAPRRRRAYRYGFPFSKDSFFEKEQKDLARCSTASTCDPAGSVDVERDSSPGFTEDYQESTVNSDPGHPSNTSSIKINEIQPTSSYSSLINFNFPSQLVAFAKLLRLLILVGRRAMESIETNSFLACTRNYLSLKLASWLE